ncbi:hypothetical protein [Actinoalloteichus spitiensis]|uniref:hypothetical protein n=1 Tax=Actinoalloteichus spitiensis TaxID=252394 RepID=UPI0002F1F2FD|nr:hypothetical protein [Actinoalloteichus spitiensis]
MKLRAFDQLLASLITTEHPEVTNVHCYGEDRPQHRTRLRVDFASGAAAYLYVDDVSGPGIPRMAADSPEVPREAL